MHYSNIVKATFLSRPNRFVAKVLLDGKERFVHVKNTGRCRELLIPGATVFLQDFSQQAQNRKYNYSLISVYKGDVLVNMDSSAPNKVVGEILLGSEAYVPDMGKIIYVKPEVVFEDSRFDFYVKDENGKEGFIEVKGVTLEEDGVAMFPDAPTIRGIKHLRGLENAYRQGYSATVIFVVQMMGCKYFTPNYKGVLEFGKALEHAEENKVNICVFECEVSSDTLKISNRIPKILNR